MPRIVEEYADGTSAARTGERATGRIALQPPSEVDDLAVSETIEAEDLRRVLLCLAQEDCVHSWRNFDVSGTFEELRQWENELRPTKIFFYYLRRGGEARLVGTGSVAETLAVEFPHAGFCVLGRCYVMPEFRKRGLYRRILEHRLEYCRKQFGADLNAIHIGSDDERVSRVITRHRLPGWPPFVHLGEEDLQIAGESRKVGAYMLLVPEYLRRLRKLLVGGDAPAEMSKLDATLAEIGVREPHNLGLLVKEAMDQGRRRGWFQSCDPHDLDALLLFCRAIPLIGLE